MGLEICCYHGRSPELVPTITLTPSISSKVSSPRVASEAGQAADTLNPKKRIRVAGASNVILDASVASWSVRVVVRGREAAVR